MTHPFRKESPQRNCDKQYSLYESYKKCLADDFNHRCGYTDIPDYYLGGRKVFHIDHRIPCSDGDPLRTDYQNLVYCCPAVNIAKSDKDCVPIDPCDTDYNQFFARDKLGNIIIKDNVTSDNIKKMYQTLKLFLPQYGEIWCIDQLEQIERRLLKWINTADSVEVSVYEFYVELRTFTVDLLSRFRSNLTDY